MVGAMTEEDFVTAIDCAFPYRRPVRWRRLSAAAAHISPNAAFMVLHEVCRLPLSRSATLAERREIIEHLKGYLLFGTSSLVRPRGSAGVRAGLRRRLSEVVFL
jgi:hypothetical protein